MKKKIYILLIILFILALSLSVLFIKNKKSITTIYATVSYQGNNYLLATTENNQEYKINTPKKYEIGDQISFDCHKVKKKNPIEGNFTNLKKLNKNINLTIEDEATDNSPIDSTPSISTPSTNNPTTPPEETISYLEELNQEIDQNQTITEKIKANFIQVVDFLFYNGTIKGKTFDNLSDEAKLKSLKLFYTIDNKIEEKYPNYKEEIKDTSTKIYSKAKEKAMTTYLEITTNLCKNNEEGCQTAKEDLKEMKKSFSLTWNTIKSISGVGLSKLKSWYEVWRDTND